MSRSSAAHPAETLSSARVRLCGPLSLEAGGREIALRGRQARVIVAFLTWNRQRPVGRDELIELLWPRDAPAEPDEVLNALLSKLRRALGPGALEGRRELALAFGADAWIDVEAAARRARPRRGRVRAPRLARCLPRSATTCSTSPPRRSCSATTTRGSRTAAATSRSCACARSSAWARPGSRSAARGIGAAERSAREIVAASPFSESGHRLLMDALAARGDVAEALRVYESLRVRLRDELGAAPGAPLRERHAQLLERRAGRDSPRRSRDERKLVTVVARRRRHDRAGGGHRRDGR